MRARNGHGGQVTFTATVRPTDHLQIDLLADRRWLDVPDGADESRLVHREGGADQGDVYVHEPDLHQAHR